MKKGFDLIHEWGHHLGQQGIQQVGLFLVFVNHVGHAVHDGREREGHGGLVLDVNVFEIATKGFDVLNEYILFLDVEVRGAVTVFLVLVEDLVHGALALEIVFEVQVLFLEIQELTFLFGHDLFIV